jgi:hypothetical protein
MSCRNRQQQQQQKVIWQQQLALTVVEQARFVI